MIRTLLSVPPTLDAFLRSRAGREVAASLFPDTFVASDPPGRRLGSGGGTVNLLHAAWRSSGARPPAAASGKTSRRASAPRTPLDRWIAERPSLVLHAGGESRRLPAYASLGKALLPVPPVESRQPRQFDQTLSHFQVPNYAQVLREAGPRAALLIASGDVWLDLDLLKIPLVATDVTGIGMRVAPEVAQHFGVFFVAKKPGGSSHGGAQPIAFFQQKPSPAEIYRHLAKYDFYVDTGLWLFSAGGVELLFRRCGWSESRQAFATPDGFPEHLDLYTELGTALGADAQISPQLKRAGWNRLTSSVIPLDDARFLHLGSSRQLFESFEQLLGTGPGKPRAHFFATPPACFAASPSQPVWVDGITTRQPVRLDGLNVLSGSAELQHPLHLGAGHCLEIAPVGAARWVFRPYAIDDPTRGKPGAGGLICGLDAAAWLQARGFSVPAEDVFDLPIYPVLSPGEIDQALLDWFFASSPDATLSGEVRARPLLSARQISERTDFATYFRRRRIDQATALRTEFEACLRHGDTRVLAQDFAAVAEFCRQHAPALGRWLLARRHALLRPLSRPEHRSRLLALFAELSAGPKGEAFRQQARASLQAAVVASTQLEKSRPRPGLKEDQIVWSRSPVRLDLAGGWTDTPPYCFEQGGSVVNVAVLLNGQPPIQVFVRPIPGPLFSLRSIDLGVTEVVDTYAKLAAFRDPRAGFSLPKAALSLAGFHPDFAGGRAYPTLRSRLQAFGGGFEISLLSAVPKGSGLGTSSILGTALLGALNRACSLGWDDVALYQRVLTVEQLLTTGGGWQDQAGALFPGAKLVQTNPGLAQTPAVKFLPSRLFDLTHANQTLLLYYTGITRLAKGILGEIVADMFLGRCQTLRTLNLIRTNALELFNTVQQGHADALHRCVARSWDLNKRLDAGTTTPEIEHLLARCGPDLTAAKLLGAGGGGYMLLCAADSAAGQRIRARLEAQPPNSRARFIDFQLAERGLEVSVS